MDQKENSGKAKGRHKHNALSAQFVRSAKGPGFYADGNGLYLKVDATGARRWVQRLVVRSARRDIALGPVALVSLAEAREQAVANRKIARTGGDPGATRKLASEIPTFAESARAVHQLRLPSWKNTKHAAQFISTLETYAFPTMGRVSIAEIDSSHLLTVLTPIWLEKPETARRVRQRMGTVLDWAVAKGWRKDNPSRALSQALPRQPKAVGRRKSLPYEQVHQCVSAVRQSEAFPLTKLAFEFLVLTAARSIEVRGARWDEIIEDGRVWVIPAERMKAGNEHRVPLSDRCVEILAQARTHGQNGLIFPSVKSGKMVSDATMLKLVRGHCPDCHIHGFRTSFKTWTQEETNAPRDVSEAALAHTVKDKSEAAYARSDLFNKRRKLMQRWANYLSQLPGNVVQIGGVG